MLVVGLTGNIASGKTTVARALAARGVHVIDADVLARDAVLPGSPALARIVERWGRSVLAADGTLDRAALRAQVFGDHAERVALEQIVHPEVGRQRGVLLAAAKAAGERVVVCDIPLLFEAHLEDDVDVVVLVDAPAEVRLGRLVAERGLARDEAAAMIAAQMPAGMKRKRSDHVIDNAGTRDALVARVDDVWRAITTRARIG